MVYTSINNDKIKNIKKLQTKKYRDLENKFFIESEHLVEEAYKSGYLETLIVDENSSFSLDIDTMKINESVKKYLSELESPKDVMGICTKKEGIIKGNRILILDGVQDPGNLGTIIRSSVAFNVDTIILSDDTVDLYNSKVVRASQGMIFSANIVRGNLLEIIPKLKEEGYEIYATKVTDGFDVRDVNSSHKIGIVMGNEGNGVKKEIFDLSEKYIYINMNKICNSLNVAVATSIILYELEK
ncbi:MAG: RNA methyltransferase [Firmicutes bacterium]|nr:RNA methyltransferase [Bacillota bacterium]